MRISPQTLLQRELLKIATSCILTPSKNPNICVFLLCTMVVTWSLKNIFVSRILSSLYWCVSHLCVGVRWRITRLCWNMRLVATSPVFWSLWLHNVEVTKDSYCVRGWKIHSMWQSIKCCHSSFVGHWISTRLRSNGP